MATELPAELLCRIAAFLSTEGRVYLAGVCTRWREILHTSPLVWSILEVKVSFKNDYVASWPSRSYILARLGANARLKQLRLTGPLHEDLPWQVEGLLRSSRYATIASGFIQSFGASHLVALTLEGWPSAAVTSIICWLPKLKYLKCCLIPASPDLMVTKASQLLSELADVVERRPAFSLCVTLPPRYSGSANSESFIEPSKLSLGGSGPPAWGISDFSLNTRITSFKCCRQHSLDDNQGAVALVDPTTIRRLNLHGAIVQLRLCPRLVNLTSLRVEGALRFNIRTQSTADKVLLISLRHLAITQPTVDKEGLLSASKFFSVLRAPYLQVLKYSSRTPYPGINTPSFKNYHAFGIDLTAFVSKSRQLKEFHLDHPMPITMTHLFDETYDIPSCFSSLETLTICNNHIPFQILRNITPVAMPKIKVLDCSKATTTLPRTRLQKYGWFFMKAWSDIAHAIVHPPHYIQS